jgi:Zinc finger domain
MLLQVCKHWLRGLCKKGDACEFLHEYNLRRMPECWWYAKYGFCSSGDECLYAHPKERKIECPDYKRGFCKLGKVFLMASPFRSHRYVHNRSGLSTKTHSTDSLPVIPHRLLPPRPNVQPGSVRFSSFPLPNLIDIVSILLTLHVAQSKNGSTN